MDKVNILDTAQGAIGEKLNNARKNFIYGGNYDKRRSGKQNLCGGKGGIKG